MLYIQQVTEEKRYIPLRTEEKRYIPLRPQERSYIPLRPEESRYISQRPEERSYIPLRPEESRYIPLRTEERSYIPLISHFCTTLFTSMFADNTACADADADLDSLITRANFEQKKIALWFRANKMAVNIGKTKFIIFQNRGKNVDEWT
jgi:hypothetical protein